MRQQETSISYKITPKRSFDKGEEFTISIRIPMELGWIDNVEFILLGVRAEHLQYRKKDERYAYFESNINLEQSAIYHYCFSYKAEGVRKYHKKVNKTGEQNISAEECWKMSVLFKVPDWAKGKVIYHIFVDCFYRSRTVQVSEMPRRHIYKDWNDTQVLGTDESGIIGSIVET